MFQPQLVASCFYIPIRESWRWTWHIWCTAFHSWLPDVDLKLPKEKMWASYSSEGGGKTEGGKAKSAPWEKEPRPAAAHLAVSKRCWGRRKSLEDRVGLKEWAVSSPCIFNYKLEVVQLYRSDCRWQQLADSQLQNCSWGKTWNIQNTLRKINTRKTETERILLGIILNISHGHFGCAIVELNQEEIFKCFQKDSSSINMRKHEKLN